MRVWGTHPEALGLNKGKLMLPDFRAQNNVTYSKWGTQLSRKALLRQGTVSDALSELSEPPAGTPVCKTTMSPTHPIDPKLETFVTGSMDHLLRCSPWRFARGDYSTLLCIHEAPSNWPDEHGLGQHCNFHSIVVPDGDVDTMYETQYYAASESPAHMYGHSPERTLDEV